MSKIKNAVIAAAILATASAGLSACNTGGAYAVASGTYAETDCTASSDATGVEPTTQGTGLHVELEQGTYFIIGQLWIQCDPQPLTHVLDVTLWYQSYSTSRWEQVKLQTYKTIPSSTQQTAFATVKVCTPGTWQLRWSVVGRDDQGEMYAYSQSWKPAEFTYLGCRSVTPTGTPSGGDGPVIL